MESESGSSHHHKHHHHHHHHKNHDSNKRQGERQHSHSHHHRRHTHPDKTDGSLVPECAAVHPRDVVRCAKPTGSPPVRRARSACEHVDDSEVWHNEPLQGTGGLRRSECTSFNATCGDDSEVLLRHCLPEVYDDRNEVEAVVMRERAEAADGKHNMGDRRLRRTDGLFFEHCKCDGRFHLPAINTDADTTVCLRDASHTRLTASASADPFDSWPTIRSEFPIMVRRPDDPSDFYSSLASSSETESE